MATGPRSQADPFILWVDKEELKDNKIKFVDKTDPNATSLVGCGLEGYEDSVFIVDPESKELLADGRNGEIWVQGPHVANGYWQKDEINEEIFEARIKDSSEGPFLRTGDLGFKWKGEFFITGRAKDLIIIRGKNHYPQDIELTTEGSHPGLQLGGAAAFSITHQDEEKLVIIQEIKRGILRSTDPEEIFSAIRENISLVHEIQAHAILLIKRRSLLKTSSGKVQRRANKKSFEDGKLSIEAAWYAPQQSENGNSHSPNLNLDVPALSTWIKEWLGSKLAINTQKIDSEDPISAYGVDSLMLVEFEVEVSDYIGKKWPVRDVLLTEPSITELAERGVEFVQEED